MHSLSSTHHHAGVRSKEGGCMRRLSVLYTTIFLSWFFASLPAPAQTTMTRKAPSYAFEVGKEYVYTYSFKQVDKTALEHHHGDSFLETRTISICTVAVDSLGEMLLVFTMTNENIDPVGDLDANGLEQGIRGGWENKFRALVSPVGHVRNGEILEPSESTRAFIEEAKNVKPGQYMWRLPDSIAVKDFTTMRGPCESILVLSMGRRRSSRNTFRTSLRQSTGILVSASSCEPTATWNPGWGGRPCTSCRDRVPKSSCSSTRSHSLKFALAGSQTDRIQSD